MRGDDRRKEGMFSYEDRIPKDHHQGDLLSLRWLGPRPLTTKLPEGSK